MANECSVNLVGRQQHGLVTSVADLSDLLSNAVLSRCSGCVQHMTLGTNRNDAEVSPLTNKLQPLTLLIDVSKPITGLGWYNSSKYVSSSSDSTLSLASMASSMRFTFEKPIIGLAMR